MAVYPKVKLPKAPLLLLLLLLSLLPPLSLLMLLLLVLLLLLLLGSVACDAHLRLDVDARLHPTAQNLSQLPLLLLLLLLPLVMPAHLLTQPPLASAFTVSLCIGCSRGW